MENSSLNETIEEWKESYESLKKNCAKLEEDLKKTQILVQELTDKNMKGLQNILDMLANDKVHCAVCSTLKSFVELHKQDVLKLSKKILLSRKNLLKTDAAPHDNECDPLGIATTATDHDARDENDVDEDYCQNLNYDQKSYLGGFYSTLVKGEYDMFNMKAHKVDVIEAKIEPFDIDEVDIDDVDIKVDMKIDLEKDSSHLNIIDGGDKEGFTCSFCQKQLRSLSYLKVHIKTIHDKDKFSFTCNTCGQSFKWKKSLVRHELIFHTEHSDTKKVTTPIHCKKCLKQFESKDDLLKHKASDHPKAKKKHKCKKCLKVFEYGIGLYKHEQEEHSDIIHKCPSCDYKTKIKYNLERHVETCDKKKCKICGEKFESQKQLKIHKATKHKKPKCFLCKEEFISIDDLKIHKTLNHKRSYNCKECPKVFNQLNSLKDHVMSHHNENGDELICPECTYTTKNRTFMGAHIKRQHRKLE